MYRQSLIDNPEHSRQNTFPRLTITKALPPTSTDVKYGKQKPRTHAESRSEETKGLSGKALGAYLPVGANVNYDINKNLRLNVGISNIFDKQIWPLRRRGKYLTNRGGLLLCRCVTVFVLMDYAQPLARLFPGGGLMAAWFLACRFATDIQQCTAKRVC